MHTAAKDVSSVGKNLVLQAIATLMETEAICDGEAGFVRVIQRDASIDLDDDQILYVVRDAWSHGQDAAGALERLLALSDAGHSDPFARPRD